MRTTLIQERTRLINRVHKVLEDAHLKLSSVLTDMLGQTGHHRLLLRELLEMIGHHDQAISCLDKESAERFRPVEKQIELLDAIPGLSRRYIEILFAEVGWDRSAFPDAAHLASLVGICPDSDESGGNRLSGRMRKGNHWVKAILVQAA